MSGNGANIKFLKRFSAFVIFTAIGLLSSDPAYALTCSGGAVGLDEAICNTVSSFAQVPGLFTVFAYLSGLVLGAMGIAKLYEHVQNPNQTSIWESIKRFLTGGALFGLPIVMEATHNLLFPNAAARAAASWGSTGWTGATSGAGLDQMLVSFIGDIYTPLIYAMWAFCYLAGIVLVIIGVMRMLKSAQDGPRGPGGFGTIMTFLTAGALFSFRSLAGVFGSSMFGTNITTTQSTLAYTVGMTAVEVGHAHAVISAILAFMIVLGLLSMLRGCFIIRDVAEGNQQASLMAGFTHLFGGALAVNLGPLMNAVQSTLGLGAYGVTFT